MQPVSTQPHPSSQGPTSLKDAAIVSPPALKPKARGISTAHTSRMALPRKPVITECASEESKQTTAREPRGPAAASLELLPRRQRRGKDVKLMASWQQEPSPLASRCLAFLICKVGSVSPTTHGVVRGGDDPGAGLYVTSRIYYCCSTTVLHTYVCVDRYTHAGDLEKVLEESPDLYNVSSDKGLFWKRKVPFLLCVR